MDDISSVQYNLESFYSFDVIHELLVKCAKFYISIFSLFSISSPKITELSWALTTLKL